MVNIRVLRIISSLYLTIFIISCSQQRIKKEIELFCKNPIQIPDNMNVIQDGILIDSVSKIFLYKIKLIIYYGPGGCTSCNVSRLIDIDPIHELSDGTSFSPIVIYSPNCHQYNELIKNLKLYRKKFPIVIDKYDQFQQKNTNFPEDTRYHTFLLDKNNRVVLVGNPLASDAMWSLFKSTLDNMLAHDGLYVPEK